MTTVSINVTNIGSANSSNKRSATYEVDTSANPATPNWAAVAADGDVHLEEAPSSGAIIIKWTLVSPPSNLTFASSNPVSVTGAPSDTFTLPGTGGTNSVSVTDNNNNNPSGQAFEYTLALSDGTSLDPKFINK